MPVNAYCLIWDNNYFYNLPPFSLGPVLAKVNREMTETVIVVPDWSTQYWYSQLMQMTNHEPLYFRPLAKNMILPDKPSENHLLHPKLQLMAIRIMMLLLKFQKNLGGSQHFKCNNYIKHRLCYSKTIGKIGVTHVLDFLGAMFDKGHGYSVCYSCCSYTFSRCYV